MGTRICRVLFLEQSFSMLSECFDNDGRRYGRLICRREDGKFSSMPIGSRREYLHQDQHKLQNKGF